MSDLLPMADPFDTPDEPESALGDECGCWAEDPDDDWMGWRPCPTNLCERDDHDHVPDWIVRFAHKVATERVLCASQRRHRFSVTLRREEAEGLLAQVNELIQPPGQTP